MSEATFINIWHTDSKEKQKRLLKAMQSEAPYLQAKAGFRELTAWSGEAEDTRIVVRGLWDSKEAFDAAVTNDPVALESRKRLGVFGSSEAGLFSEAFRAVPDRSVRKTTVPSLPAGITSHKSEVNGQTIHYLRVGNGPLVLPVHGYPESSRAWLKVMPALAEHFTVVAPDTRGTGDSSAARNFTIPQVADDLFQLVQALGFREVVLVGQDFGVQVVSAYAAEHPESVRGLVVMESPLSGFGLEDLFAKFWHFGFLRSPFAEMLIQGREDAFFRAFAFGDFVYQKSAFTEHDIARYIDDQTRPDRLAAGFDYYRALESSAEFFCKTVATPWPFPVLAVDGDHSMKGLTEMSFRRIAPNLQAKLVADCGHFIQEEQPGILAGILLDFARSCTSSKA